MNKSENINELAAALSKAQSEIRGAHKESTNPFFNSKYADLESVWDAIRSPFAKNGLAITQTTEWEQGMGVAVTTTLMHSSGQWIEGVLPIMASKVDPQGIGSAISYSRRYALAAMCGVYQVDDDAEKTKHKDATDHQAKAKPTQTKADLRPRDTIPEFDLDDSQKAAGSFVIPFGQYQGKRIDEVLPTKLQSYIKYLEEGSAKAGKPLGDMARNLISSYEVYTAHQKPTYKHQDDTTEIPF